MEQLIHASIPQRLGPDDAAALSELERLCFSAPWKLEQIRSALGLPHFIAYGIKSQGVLQAYIALAHIADELEVLNLATHPTARRTGLARNLLKHTFDEALHQGVERVILEVRTGNTPALNLYASFGMTRIGLRKHYYADTGEDALVLHKVLEKSAHDVYPSEPPA